MSRCSVRIMIMATMPDKNSTIMSELMMLNQWIWSSVISRYVSQRDAHRMSLCCRSGAPLLSCRAQLVSAHRFVLGTAK